MAHRLHRNGLADETGGKRLHSEAPGWTGPRICGARRRRFCRCCTSRARAFSRSGGASRCFAQRIERRPSCLRSTPFSRWPTRRPCSWGWTRRALGSARDISNWEPQEVPDTLGAFLDPSEQVHPDVDGAVFAELRANMMRLTPRGAELVATAKAINRLARGRHGFLCPLRREDRDRNGRLAARLPGLRRSPFPAYRPGGDHADHAWKFGSDGPVSGLARGHVLVAGRVRGTGRIHRGRRAPRSVRGIRSARGAGRLSVVAALAVSVLADVSAATGMRQAATSTSTRPEIEDARWVTREDMLEAFAGRNPAIKPARKGAIARFLIERWLADTLA